MRDINIMGYLFYLHFIFYYTFIIAKYDELSRDKYPKKDCECDCLGEHPVNTDDEFITISMGRKIRNPDYRCKANNYVHNACLGDIPVEFYMRRGDKVYFRGDGVKVVITVK